MRRIFGVIALSGVLLLAGSTAQFAHAGSGDLDRSFGLSNGKTVTGSPSYPTAISWLGPILNLPNGKTIAAQRTAIGDRNLLVKRFQNGSRVAEYGRNGTLLLPLIRRRTASLDKVKIRGTSTALLSSLELKQGTVLYIERRSNSTGARERNFGKRGVASISIREFLPKYAEDSFQPTGLELDAKGRVYISGEITWSHGPGLIIRLTRKGRIDRSFATNGAVVLNKGQCKSVDDMAIARDGVFVLAEECVRLYDSRGRLDRSFSYDPKGDLGHARSITESGVGTLYLEMSTNSDYVTGVERLDSDGSVMTNYGSPGDEGLARPDFPGVSFSTVGVDSDGSAVFGGQPEPDDAIQAIGKIGSDGLPDPEFNGDGLMLFDPLLDWRASYPDFTFVPDGVIVTGEARDHFVYTAQAAKLLDDGSLDDSFGEGGIAKMDALLPPVDRMLESIRTPGGGTIAAGQSDQKAAFVKFRRNGSIDRNWGDDGWLRFRASDTRFDDVVQRLALADDGKLLACLDTGTGLQVARITADGHLDPDLGGDGTVDVDIIARCSGIFPAPGDRILVGGTKRQSIPGIARLNEDGSLDTNYGDGGYAFGDWTVIRGRSRYASYGFEDGSSVITTPEVMTRFGPDGERDSSFGGDGTLELPGIQAGLRMERPVAFAEAPGGSLLLGGYDRYTLNRMVVLKVRRNGRLANGFGKKGVRVIKTPVKKPQLTDLKIQADGRIVISSVPAPGYWFRPYVENVRVIRLLGSGRIDRSFGKRGTVIVRTGANAQATSLTINRDGIIVAGYAETNSGRDDAMLIQLKR